MNSFGSRYERLANIVESFGGSPDEVLLPAEGMVTGSRGVRLHYLEWPGPLPDPMLLFLHGGGLHAHSFDAVGLLLRRAGRCVALDLRGHGESEWSTAGEYNSAVVADDLDAVVAGLGAERVVVVAHSLGGLAALTWAGRRPPALAGLILVDIAPDLQHEGSRAVGDLILQRPSFADLEEAEAFLGGSRAAATSGVALTVAWDDSGRLTWKHDTAQFQRGAGIVPSGEQLWASAGRTACPTLVLRGARSRVVTAAGAAALAAAIPQGAWREVPAAGHTIQSSNPRGLAAEVLTFLAALEQGEP
jgi:pimeloyl-ACP methyl ester carboxylesterase